MKKKPGVFDPFRQNVEPPPPDPTEMDPQDIALDAEAAASQPRGCVTFSGNRFGINVWVPTNIEDREFEAREQLGRLIHEFAANTVLWPVLAMNGFVLGEAENGVVVGVKPNAFTLLNTATPTEKLAGMLRVLEKTYA